MDRAEALAVLHEIFEALQRFCYNDQHFFRESTGFRNIKRLPDKNKMQP